MLAIIIYSSYSSNNLFIYSSNNSIATWHDIYVLVYLFVDYLPPLECKRPEEGTSLIYCQL